ncbi:MAG: NAD(P)-binding domain-containing protein [Rhodobacteraceae bacterium]|nr:NAD(P)-binding domain-containing protein [Paracoccaceae bacterium]
MGILGGTGALGSAIAQAPMTRGGVPPERLVLGNRSGARGRFAGVAGLRVMRDPAALVAASDAVILAVAPRDAWALSLAAGARPVISVMAGIPLAALAGIAGTARVIRAMSSPAAARGLAFSPFVAAPGATAADRALALGLLSACGPVEEVGSEAEIDVFTALTGPMPGFVALFADAVLWQAEAAGVPADRALRAVRQMFRAGGELIAEGPPPGAHVAGMIAYAGTTAAGMRAMRRAGLDRAVGAGIAAAVAAARALGTPPG